MAGARERQTLDDHREVILASYRLANVEVIQVLEQMAHTELRQREEN